MTVRSLSVCVCDDSGDQRSGVEASTIDVGLSVDWSVRGNTILVCALFHEMWSTETVPGSFIELIEVTKAHATRAAVIEEST